MQNIYVKEKYTVLWQDGTAPMFIALLIKNSKIKNAVVIYIKLCLDEL